MPYDISVIIPCYNHGGFLERAVRSVISVNLDSEIIIVDDCSTDNSWEVATSLGLQLPQVVLARMEKNAGPGAARNRGIAESSSKYLCFLDADDELLPGFLDEAFALLQKNTEINLVKGEMEFFDPIKGYILPASDPRHSSAILSSVCGMLIRTEILRKISGFSESSTFRNIRGGEDVALMKVLIEYFQPIAKIGFPCYRVNSCDGGHTDRFLASTRLAGSEFEFVDAVDNGLLAEIDAFVENTSGFF